MLCLLFWTLIEEVRTLLHQPNLEATTLGHRRERNVRILANEVIVETLEERSAVELYKSVSQLNVHDVDVASVRPVRVVYGSESDALAFAGERSDKHVRRVEGVDEVGREGRALSERVDEAAAFVLEIDGLEGSLEDVLPRDLLVGLSDGESEWGDPGDETVAFGDERSACGEPVHDGSGTCEHLSDGVECGSC